MANIELTQLKGIGPSIVEKLHLVGIFNFLIRSLITINTLIIQIIINGIAIAPNSKN